jgi:O-methyltransferase
VGSGVTRASIRKSIDELLRSIGFLPKEERDELALARRYEHYWYNAQKKIDLRRMDGFGEVAWRVHKQGRTYLHLDRLYTLWQGVINLPSASTAVIEIGVYRGGSVRFLGETLQQRGIDIPVYACDTFDGHTVVDDKADTRHVVGKQFTGVSVDKIRKYLQDLRSVQVIPGDIQLTAPTLSTQDGFGLVHIDVDVYPITKFCLDYFAPRLVAGGTIVVDDYGFKTCPGAKQAVDEFAAANPSFRLLHLLTGQAVLIPLAN